MSNFPGSIDSFPMPQGTTQLSDAVADHATLERNHGSSLIAVQTFLGTSGGTNVFQGYTAGQFPLPIKSGTLGTTIANGTINNGILGTPAITGGTFNNGVFGTVTLQAPTINGAGTNSGTMVNGVYNSATFGTPQINGGTLGSTSVLQPLQSAFFYQGSSTLTTATIPFANKLLDILSEYNGTQFVAAQAGIYEFCTQTAMSGNSADFNLEIHYNGTVVSTMRCNPNGFGIPITWLGSLVAGGTVISYSSGGTGAIGTASYFWGKRVF